MKYLLVLLAGLLSCGPAPCSAYRLGYTITDGNKTYDVHPTHTTPLGIQVDGDVDLDAVDKATAELEVCLGPIDHRAFVVKVPDDWALSCDGTQQVLNSGAPEIGCDAKGLQNDCPCRWRALVQCPNVIVTTPNLLLYKDALTRFLTQDPDPWLHPMCI